VTTRPAPAGAVLRLLTVRWIILAQYGVAILFLGWVSALAGDTVERLWLLAPTIAFVTGILPGGFTRGLPDSPLTHTVPGLDEGVLRSTLLLGLWVAALAGGGALVVRVPVVGALALAALALALYMAGASLLLVERTARPEGGHLERTRRILAFLPLPVGVVGLHLLWLLAPELPSQVGGRSPGLVIAGALLLLLPLVPVLARAHRLSRGGGEGHGRGPVAGSPAGGGEASPSLVDPSRDEAGGEGRSWIRRRWVRLSWGSPPAHRMWRETPVRAALRAGHLERARINGNTSGWFVEWLVLPALLIGIGWVFDLFTLVLMGAAVASVYPGLVPVGTLSYPLSRAVRTRVAWAGHLVQGVAGILLSGLLFLGLGFLFGPLEDGFFAGEGTIPDVFLLLGLTFACLPVAMVAAAHQAPLWRSAQGSLPPLRMLSPAMVLIFAVLGAGIVFARMGWLGDGPLRAVAAVAALAGVLHAAGWLYLRGRGARTPLGPSR